MPLHTMKTRHAAVKENMGSWVRLSPQGYNYDGMIKTIYSLPLFLYRLMMTFRFFCRLMMTVRAVSLSFNDDSPGGFSIV
jgi:hypothetical protein